MAVLLLEIFFVVPKNPGRIQIHMVKNHEGAYRLKKLSLFTVECGQKNKKYGENWLLWYIPMSGEYFRIIFVSQGAPKIARIDLFWSPL